MSGDLDEYGKEILKIFGTKELDKQIQAQLFERALRGLEKAQSQIKTKKMDEVMK